MVDAREVDEGRGSDMSEEEGVDGIIVGESEDDEMEEDMDEEGEELEELSDVDNSILSKEYQKPLKKSSVFLRACVTTAFYPVEYVKTLMQLGYEPFPPINSHTLLGRRCLLLPNSFTFIQYVKRVDGLVGCFRGLGPRLVQQSVFIYVNQLMAEALNVTENLDDGSESEQITLSAHLGEGDRAGSPDVEIVRITSRHNSEESCDALTWHGYVKNLTRDWCCRMTGLIVSFPFQVIAIRTVAEFVGRENNFSLLNGFVPGIIQIYTDHGFLGFFRGIVPRMIGDSIHLFACGILRYLIRTQVYCEELRACMGVSTSILVGSLTYPFTVVSNTMIVNGASELAMGHPPLMPLYTTWLECWKHLSSLNQLRRGSSLFFRYYAGPRKVSSNGLLTPTGIPFGPDLQSRRPSYSLLVITNVKRKFLIARASPALFAWFLV